MFQKWVSCLLIIGGAIFVSLAFSSPARAKDCGGPISCACGDNVTASRDIRDDPIFKANFCPGTGLFVTADNVTLLMKGEQLYGSSDPHEQRGPGNGIHITANNVTITGGRIEGFQHGVFGVTSNSTISGVNNDHNAVNGINITGDDNTIIDSAGAHVLGDSQGNGKGDGILIIGNDNELIKTYTQKTASGFVGLRVMGSGNFLQENFVDKGDGGGLLVTGGGNIDGGRNRAKRVQPPVCVIDGVACLP